MRSFTDCRHRRGESVRRLDSLYQFPLRGLYEGEQTHPDTTGGQASMMGQSDGRRRLFESLVARNRTRAEQPLTLSIRKKRPPPDSQIIVAESRAVRFP